MMVRLNRSANRKAPLTKFSVIQDTFRDATVGQILHYISRGRILPYPEEKLGYVVLDRYQGKLPSVNTTATSSTLTLAVNDEKPKYTSGAVTPGSASIRTVVGEQDIAAKFAADQDAVERGDVAQETRRCVRSYFVTDGY